MDVKQQSQALFKRAQTQLMKVIDSIQHSLSLKLMNFRLSYENQLQQYLTTITNDVSQDDAVYEVNAFRFDIKSTMAELNKFLVHLNSFKLTSLINRRNSICSNIKRDPNDQTEEKEDDEIPPPSTDKEKNQNVIQCEFCCKNISRPASYKYHLKEKHQKVTTFLCPICNFLEAKVIIMAAHMLEQHLGYENGYNKGEMKYICPFTSQSYTNLQELVKYLNSHPKYLRVVGGKSYPSQEQNEELLVKVQHQVEAEPIEQQQKLWDAQQIQSNE